MDKQQVSVVVRFYCTDSLPVVQGRFSEFHRTRDLTVEAAGPEHQFETTIDVSLPSPLPLGSPPNVAVDSITTLLDPLIAEQVAPIRLLSVRFADGNGLEFQQPPTPPGADQPPPPAPPGPEGPPSAIPPAPDQPPPPAPAGDPAASGNAAGDQAASGNAPGDPAAPGTPAGDPPSPGGPPGSGSI